MAQFAASAFDGTEGDNLSTLDANWVKQSGSTGNAEIASGRARASSTATAHYYYNTAPASADYSASVEVYNPGASTGSAFGPSVRMVTGANTSYHARYSSVVSGVQLYKFVSGTATLLGSASKTAPASGTSAVLTISVSGSTIDVTWNGEGSPAISVTDTSITAAGYPGVRWSTSSAPTDTNGWQGDNFSADEAGGGTVYANFNQTDAGDTLAASATLTVSASATLTDQADSLSATAEVPVAGVTVTANITDESDTASSTAQVLVQSALTQQDSADTLAGSAAVAVGAFLTVTDEADTLAATAEIVAAGGVLASLNLTDADDTVTASADVTQPEPGEEVVSLGGRRRRDWRTFQNLPTWEVTVEARLTDDDDTLAATAQVLPLEPAQIVVQFDAVDDADTLLAGCAVRWTIPQLVRTSPPLIRTTTAAGR